MKLFKSHSVLNVWTSALLLTVPVLGLQVAISQVQTDMGSSSFSAAMAAEEAEKKPPQETRRTPALRNKVYEQLSEAQVFVEAKQYTEAIEVLKDMEEQSGKRALNSYELANLYNLFAFVYYSQEDYDGALRAYSNVVKQPDIPIAMEINTRYTIAQLYFVKEEWENGVNALLDWFKVAPDASAT